MLIFLPSANPTCPPGVLTRVARNFSALSAARPLRTPDDTSTNRGQHSSEAEMKNHRGRSPLELKTDFQNSCFIPFLLLEVDEDSRKDRICVGRAFFFLIRGIARIARRISERFVSFLFFFFSRMSD